MVALDKLGPLMGLALAALDGESILPINKLGRSMCSGLMTSIFCLLPALGHVNGTA